jgi:putative ABC transport system substrate-binding protein
MILGLREHMRRRDFITLLGGAAAWPLAARAQQPGRMRHIGVLMNVAENDPETQTWLAALRQGLDGLGWTQGRNVHLIVRSSAGRPDQLPVLAKELLAAQPDVILTHAPPSAAAMQRESRTIPIVFVAVSDPIGPGFVASLARPGGNMTGLLTFEPGITGKWLAMLKEIAPRLERVALVANPRTTNYDYFQRNAEAAAPGLNIEIVSHRVATAADIERAIIGFAEVPNGGLFVPPDTTGVQNRHLIIALAVRHRLPAVYPFRFFAADGGLMSYGVDQAEMFRQAAFYVDRILRGANSADTPVQAPTKYTTVVNLKSAKAIGLEVPPSLLVRADEVIE